MKRAIFKCTFLSDVIISANAATQGNNQILDYIPGATCLGRAALPYNSFKDYAFKIFHSGEVQFGDAHPACNGAKSFKIPYSWYHEKGQDYVEENNLKFDRIFIHHKSKKGEGKSPQLKQIRKGFFLNNIVINPDHFFAIKSAYDSAKRKSKESQLYGYNALRKGSEWIFYVDSKEEKLLNCVSNEITGIHSIGRSKSAQYGQIKIEKLNIEADDIYKESKEVNKILIYAESMLICYDKFGESTFQPSLQNLYLPDDAKILWKDSQIRTRVYSPWNNARQMKDRDIVGIDKGSVIIAQVPDNFDLSNFKEKIKEGVGFYKNEGKGKVLINPVFLNGNPHPDDSSLVKKEENQQKNQEIVFYSAVDQDENDNNVFEWIESSLDIQSKNLKIIKAVNDFIQINKNRFSKVTSSQWGSVREKAQQAKDYDEMRKNLFKQEEGFLMHGKSEKIWARKQRKAKLEDALGNINQTINGEYARIFTIKLCSEMAKIAAKYKNSAS